MRLRKIAQRMAADAARAACLVCVTQLAWLPCAHGANPADKKVPDAIRQALQRGLTQDIIVEFDDKAVRKWADDAVRRRGLQHEDQAIIESKALRFGALKRAVFQGIGPGAALELRAYDHLPLAFLRVRDRRALDRLAARAEVVAVYPDERKRSNLDATSAGLVGQPAAAGMGHTGSGTSVLVIDGGVNYTLAEFGSCTAPGVPASCKVVYANDLTGTATQLDHHGHGTNVSGIVIGTAPDARIVMQNVFGANNFTSDSLILQAINWGIANRSAYNIRAINMSLGDGSLNAVACSAGNPYRSAVQTAWNAGLITVASAGNEGFTSGIGKPACTPYVVSVGAVYSADWGGLAWSSCTDNPTAADKVICVSNSASILTLLAPGALVTAGGSQLGGTSQASPFVAGAVAVLRAAFPGETLSATVSRLTSTGVPVTDPRNGLVKPRLNLGQAVRPVNDLFVNRMTLNGNSGATAGNSVNATHEVGEPAHAGNAGAASLWWSWTPVANGQASLDTTGSGIATLLAVYTGASVSSLSPVAARVGNGALFFQGVAGTSYAIAVDGSSGASGNVSLGWSLNTSAAADLSLTFSSGAGAVSAGSTVNFDAVIHNNGPQAATNVMLSDTLPAGLSYVSGTAGCSANAASVTCAIGTLASGSNANVVITVLTAGTGTFQSDATVTSEVTDPVAANNIAAAILSVTAAVPGQVVPAVSGWGMLLFALALGAILFRQRTTGASVFAAGRRR
ncbi:MAG: S8 family serine peptidase [Burkholderiales bacterium]